MGKKVLITGGSGMLGSHITKKLLSQGYTVNHLSRNPEKSEKVKSFHWDPKAGEFDQTALQDVDHIINLAGANIGEKKWTPERKKEIRDSRIKSTAFLREQLKQSAHQVKTFISASGMSYYGWDNGDRWQKESSRFGDDFMATVTKDWEEESLAFKELGIRVVIFRFGIVFSKNGGALPRLIWPVKLGLGAGLGSGQQWISWVHIDDVAKLVSFTIDNELLSGIYNIGTPNPVTNKEFNKIAASVLKKPFFLPNVPAFGIKMVFGELATTVLGSCRLSPDKILDTGFKFTYPTVDGAISDFYV